jgi:hypothetical protein
MKSSFAEFVTVGMAFSFIVLVSFLFGYQKGKTDLALEANSKITQALKLER